MTTKPKEFLVALSRVIPLAKGRTTIPALSCVQLRGTAGRLTATCSNLDAHAAASCPCEGELPFVCVDALALQYLVQKANDGFEDSLVTLDIGTQLKVVGNGTSHLSINPGEEFPAWPNSYGAPLGVPTEDLAECIKRVAWATEINPKISLDLWKEVVWVKTTAKTLECAGCNGKEFAYANRALICGAAEFMFPSKLAPFLCESLNTGGDLLISDNWISTTSETFKTAVIRANTNKYVPIQFLLGQQQTPLGVLGSLEMDAILDALHTIRKLDPESIYLVVKFEFEPEQLRISFKNVRASYEVETDHEYKGPPLTVKFDVDRAIKVFSHLASGSKVFMGAESMLFAEGDFTYALATLKTE